MNALRSVLAGILVLAVVSGLLVTAAIERTLPARDATLALPGLHSQVDIVFDRYGIPRVRASDEFDAAEALGYVHARDRMMQMDLMRRAASGELSALVGPAALRLDETARVLGTRVAAERSLGSLSSRTRALLDAYSRGVNQFIAERGRFAAPEYVILGKPRSWSPVDCMLWAETMGLALSDNMPAELARMALSTRMPTTAILSLWPASHAMPADQASLPRIGALARATLASLPRFPEPFTLPDTASNEWAVDGRHSASGAPLLAGDPHLAYSLPCLWYLARIETPAGTEVGATAPGTPFIVLGQNGRIAWTLTSAGADTEDLFVERVLDTEHYESPAGPLAFGHRLERIVVRGQRDVVVDVRQTRHGPVISDLPDLFRMRTPHQGYVISASIASLAPDNQAADGLAMLDRATDVRQAGLAASLVTAPVQNLLVADRHAIALFTTGRVPIRRSGDGRVPAAGWDGRQDWSGYASGDALPHVIAPASGVLVNANEPVVGTGSTVPMTGDPHGDWRARRIRTLLAAEGDRFDVERFAAMQGDVTSAYMAALLPILRSTIPGDTLSAQALALVRRWDGTMSRNRAEPLIVHAWLARLARAFDGRIDNQVQATAPLDYVLAALERRAPGCDGPCANLLTRTLADALSRLSRRYGSDPAAWRWGSAHRAIFSNPLWDRVPFLGDLVCAAVPVGGDGSTIDAQGAVSSLPFDSVHGAAYRGVYDLADPDRSRFIIATGQSGNPFSPHVLDLVPIWQKIGTVTIPHEAGRSSSRLILLPAHGAV